MSTTTDAASVLAVPSKAFVASCLPLYSGPQVRVRIGSAGHQYQLSKSLLCEQSPYFRAAFEGKFREAEEELLTLTEDKGVASTQSLEMLIQWLYLGQVIFQDSKPEEKISQVIEFSRLADLCKVVGPEKLMADTLKAATLASFAQDQRTTSTANVDCITVQHIRSAICLPYGHHVRRILAGASIEGYLQGSNQKFREETRNSPDYAVDVLDALRDTLRSFDYIDYGIKFKNPITGNLISFKRG